MEFLAFYALNFLPLIFLPLNNTNLIFCTTAAFIAPTTGFSLFIALAALIIQKSHFSLALALSHCYNSRVVKSVFH